ncbi:MAG: hypothetical protein Crog4KO_05620 [Crocinitomicaceae bacterium]
MSLEKEQRLFQLQSNSSKSIKAMSVQELEQYLLTSQTLLETEPWKEEGFFDMTYDEKVAKIFELMDDVKPKHRDRYRDEDSPRYDRFVQTRNNVLSALYLVQSMKYDEQKKFAKNYPDQFEKITASLTWEDLSAPGAGFITGIDITFEKTEDDDATLHYDHPLLQILSEEKYYTGDNAVLYLAIDICSQVVDYESDTEDVKSKKKTFREEVVFLLGRYANNLGLETRDADPETSEGYQHWIWAYLRMYNIAKQGHSKNTGLLNTIWRFSVNGGLGTRHTKLNGISLKRFQETKSDGGHVYGVKFGEQSYVNIELDLNNGFQEKQLVPGAKESAYAHLQSGKVDMDGLHYFGANYSVHMGDSSFENVRALMTWPSNRTSDEHISRNELVEGRIRYIKADLALNDIRYAARDKDGKQYTIGLSKVKATGLKISDMWIIDKAKTFRNNSDAISQLIYGSMNSMFILTDAVMAAVSQMTSIGDTLDAKDFQGFKDDMNEIRIGNTNLKVHMDNLVIKGYLDASKPEFDEDNPMPRFGAIESMEFGSTDLIMKRAEKPSNEQLDELEKNRIEIAKLEKKLAKFYRQKRKRILRDADLSKLNEEIDDYEKIISEKLESISEINRLNRFTLTVETEDKINFTNAFYVEGMVKDLFDTYLREYGIEDINGLQSFNLGEGLSFATTVATNEASGELNLVEKDLPQRTRVHVPNITIGSLNDDSFAIKLGGLVLTGNDLNITGLKGNAKVSWTDVNIPEEGTSEKVDLITDHLELTNGRAEVQNLVLTDKKTGKPEIKISGKATLVGMSLKFFSEEKDDFSDVEFECDYIEIENVAEFKQENESNPELKNWFVEGEDNTIRLNGFKIRNNALTSAVAANGNIVEERVTELSVTKRGSAKKLMVDGIKVNTGISLLDVKYISEEEKKKVSDDEYVIVREKSTTTVSFGLDELEMPIVNKKTKRFQLAHFDYTGWQLKDYVESQKRRLAYFYEDLEKNRNKKSGYADKIQERIEYDLENIRNIKRMLNRYTMASSAPTDSWLKGIRGNVTFISETSAMDTDKPKVESKVIKVNNFGVDRIYTHNLKLVDLKTRKQIMLNGDNVIEGFGIENAIYENETVDLQPGGRVFGGPMSLAWFTIKGFNLDKFGVGGWSFEKLVDKDGYKYSVDDLTVGYESDVYKRDIDGELNLSFEGTYHDDEDKKVAHLTFATNDLIYVPQIKMENFSILGDRKGVGIHGLSVTADFKYSTYKKNGKTKKKLKKIIIKKMTAGRVYMTDTEVKFGTDESVIRVDEGNKIWLNNVNFTNVEYDLTKKGKEAFNGTVSSKSFDLTDLDFVRIGGKDNPLLYMLGTGVSGDAMTFEKATDGTFDINLTSPTLLMQTVKAFGLNLGARNYTDDKMSRRFLKAGSIHYKQKKEGSEGHFLTIKNAEFYGLSLGGDFNNDKLNVEIKDVAIGGKVTGDLIVDFVPGKQIKIKADGSSFMIEKMKLFVPDLRPITEKNNNKSGAPVRSDYSSETAYKRAMYKYQQEKFFMRQIVEEHAYEDAIERQVRLRLGISDEYYLDLLDNHILKLKKKPYSKDLEKDYQEFREKMDDITAGRVSDDYAFLDHMISGDVKLSLFGQTAKLKMLRVQPNKTALTSKYPADKAMEETLGGGYVTYVDLDSFFTKVSKMISKGAPGTWLENAAGDGELHVVTENGDLVLKSDIVVTKYLLTLVKELNRRNSIRPFLGKHYVRLSSVVDTIVYNQAWESMLRYQNPDQYVDPITRFVKWLLPGLEPGIERSVSESLSFNLHHGLRPKFSLTNAEFDIKYKRDYEKGLLNIFTGFDDNPKVSLELSLNQGERTWGSNFFGEKFTWKNLGPQVKIFNTQLPQFRHESGDFLVYGKGINIGSLSLGKTQMDVPDYRSDGLGHTKPDYSAWMDADNVEIKDFNLEIPLDN